MTVALSDTKLLCDMLQPLPDFTDSIATANQTAEFYTKRKPLSATINTLANALYKVSVSMTHREDQYTSSLGLSFLCFSAHRDVGISCVIRLLCCD